MLGAPLRPPVLASPSARAAPLMARMPRLAHLARAVAPAAALLPLLPRPERRPTVGPGPRPAGARSLAVRCQGSELRPLYPEIEARKTGSMKTRDGKHEIYYEVSGNPKGKPAVFLHGGPGDGCSPKHRRLFDPEAYCVILFDQRGAGQSQPAGSLEENTTEKLLEDMEQLRELLGLESWMLVGGSWGSALALSYATRFPERVQGMVLYSVFVPSQEAIEFPYSAEGAGLFFPEAYEALLRAVPVEERKDVIAALAKRVTSPDPAVKLPAVSAYVSWILRLLTLTPDEALIAEAASKPEEAGPGPGIEMHYMVN
ncbi:unnamed protein product, partial [Effrenium voratum]